MPEKGLISVITNFCKSKTFILQRLIFANQIFNRAYFCELTIPFWVYFQRENLKASTWALRQECPMLLFYIVFWLMSHHIAIKIYSYCIVICYRDCHISSNKCPLNFRTFGCGAYWREVLIKGWCLFQMDTI